MGCWGPESCSNDRCWDYLETVDIYNMTQKEANKSLVNVWKDKNTNFERLGVVIWLLAHNFTVPINKLRDVLSYAQDELLPNRLEDWISKTKRKLAVLREIREIKAAIKSKGKGKKRHIKGLDERMGEIEDTTMENLVGEDMWLLRFYGREELCQLALSTDIEKLKKRAGKEMGEKLKFHQTGDIIFVHKVTKKGTIEIGIIGKVEII